MLILTRRQDESIVIGDDIEITITEARAGSVRIGIDAPKHVVILRKELMGSIDSRGSRRGSDSACTLV